MDVTTEEFKASLLEHMGNISEETFQVLLDEKIEPYLV